MIPTIELSPLAYRSKLWNIHYINMNYTYAYDMNRAE